MNKLIIYPTDKETVSIIFLSPEWLKTYTSV